MLLASVLVLGYLFFFKRSSLKIKSKHFLAVFLYGFLSIYLTNALEFWSLQHLTAAKTCFLYSLSPFFAAFFSYLHFGEKMNLRKALGMGLGVLGVLLPLIFTREESGATEGFFFLSWPEITMIGAVLASVYGWVLLRRLVKDSDSCSSPAVNGFGMLIGGALALVTSFSMDSWSNLPLNSLQFPSFAQNVLILTLISNVICYNLYGWMLKRFTATFLSFAGLTSPIFASLHGWIFLSEQPSYFIFLSTGIFALGFWLVYSAEMKQGYLLQAPQKSPALQN
jgi:drug/metabolite transporter (DMT)-like permease